jgi:hypothetical protein
MRGWRCDGGDAAGVWGRRPARQGWNAGRLSPCISSPLFSSQLGPKLFYALRDARSFKFQGGEMRGCCNSLGQRSVNIVSEVTCEKFWPVRSATLSDSQ